MMASLEPTFLWRRILDEKTLRAFHACLRGSDGRNRRDADDLRHNICQTDRINTSRGNASTPTEPTERCIVTFRL
jgi:hypothetical protein